MQCYTHTLPGGASLVGYLREETTEMPAFNTHADPAGRRLCLLQFAGG